MSRSGPAACTVELAVTNTGDRPGSDVVQLYLEAPPGDLFRPRRELVGSAKIQLAAGETATARIELGPRAFAHWNPANKDHVALRARMSGAADVIPAGGGPQHVANDAGWYIAPGDYVLTVARSVADHVHAHTITVDEPIGPLTGEDSMP